MSRRMKGTETVIEKEIKQWEMERERGEEWVGVDGNYVLLSELCWFGIVLSTRERLRLTL